MALMFPPYRSSSGVAQIYQEVMLNLQNGDIEQSPKPQDSLLSKMAGSISIASWDFLEFSSTMKIDPICELWSFPALIAYTRDRKTVRIVQRKQQTYPISLCLTLCSSPSPCLHAERYDYVYIVYIYIYTYT